MKTVLTTLFLTFSLTTSAICDFAEKSIIFSESKTKDYNDKDQLVEFYPKLTSFEVYFPATVKINTKLAGDCSRYKLKLSVYLKEGKKPIHDHDHNHEKGPNKSKASGGSKETAKYLNDASYVKLIDITKDKNNYSFEKIPHLKFYEKLDEKKWYHQVKYNIEIVTNKDAVVKRQSLLLDSPMAD